MIHGKINKNEIIYLTRHINIVARFLIFGLHE